MAETTGIAWTDHTWSPWIGCTKVSPGCDHCYAEALDARHKYGLDARARLTIRAAPHWGAGKPRYRTKQWGQPLKWNAAAAKAGIQRRIFPSLCDPFDNEVPDEWRYDWWQLIAQTPNLIWLLLTKRIGNAAKMLPQPLPSENWPHFPNVWIGASVVNQEEADRDIPKLLATPAAKRFVSYEPALGPVQWYGDGHNYDGWDWLRGERQEADAGGAAGVGRGVAIARTARIDWLIVGGESAQGGAKARPFDIAWARDAVRQCKATGGPVFVKQLGSAAESFGSAPGGGNAERARLRFKDRAGADPGEWPEDLRVQEFPK